MVNATRGEIQRWLGLLCVGFALLTGCQSHSQQAACPLPGQTRMISLKLYFGRNIPGIGAVTDAAFAHFAETVLTPAFPDGFTAYPAVGQWRNPHTGQIDREQSFVVEIVGPVDPTTIGNVTAAYRAEFHQLAVGQLSEEVCAVF